LRRSSAGLLLAREFCPVGGAVAGLDLDELERVGRGETPGVEAIIALLGEIDALPIEVDHASERLGGLLDLLAADFADGCPASPRLSPP